MLKSVKVMLVPNKSQRTRLFQFAGTARFAYNWALRKEIDAYEAGENTATHVKLEAVATSKKRNKQQLNWFRFAERGRISLGMKYKEPRITFDGLNWWLSVAVEFADLKPAENCTETVGIDLGIKNLATCSDGTTYQNINRASTVRRLKKKQRRLQRCISRKYEMNNKKGESYSKTRNIIKSEKKLLRVHHRLANIRQDYRHQITSFIIGRKPNSVG